MSTTDGHGHAARSGPGRRVRALSAAWWTGALLMAPPFLMLMVASDFLQDRYPGAVLGVLVLAAAFAAARVRTWPVQQGRQLSLLVSAVWLAGAALVYPTQEVALNAAYSAGVPVVVALTTVVLGLRLGRTGPAPDAETHPRPPGTPRPPPSSAGGDDTGRRTGWRSGPVGGLT